VNRLLRMFFYLHNYINAYHSACSEQVHRNFISPPSL